MKVLDLFAGLCGWSNPFATRGHDTFTIELETRFPSIDWYADIQTVSGSEILRRSEWDRVDILLASPPCTAFTTMTMGRNWTYDGEPRTPTAEMGKRLFMDTYRLIRELRPRYIVIENPRARLRTLPFAPDLIANLTRSTVWYCRYGEQRAKPTDIWHNIPTWIPREGCRNGFPDHLAAPRGSTSGTQGMPSDIAARIPVALATEISEAVERAMASQWG